MQAATVNIRSENCRQKSSPPQKKIVDLVAIIYIFRPQFIVVNLSVHPRRGCQNQRRHDMRIRGRLSSFRAFQALTVN